MQTTREEDRPRVHLEAPRPLGVLKHRFRRFFQALQGYTRKQDGLERNDSWEGLHLFAPNVTPIAG